MTDGIGQFFWIFLIISALQPVLKQRMLEARRVRLIRAIERARRSRVIALVHRQESMGLLGFPLFKFINIEDAEEVLRAIRMTPKDVPIDIVLHTPGGLAIAAEQIARALLAHPARVTAFVPHHAMSGGTLIALGADEIVMDPHAILGPVDPQLESRPAASILRAVARKEPKDIDDKTLIDADIAAMALRQMHDCVVALLEERLPPAHVERAAAELTEGRYTHDHALDEAALRDLGLPVSTALPTEVHELMALYPQPVKRTPTVEYLPDWRPGGDRR